MTTKDIEDKLAGLLGTIQGKEYAKSSGNTGLFVGSDGTFDSVTGLNLILAIEQEFHIAVDDDEIQPKNFASFDAIVKYVERKRNSA
ncbi:MAG TPA: acyl carrier protein [Candidatus Binatia bacterium]|jgi:acyl carrier protein